MFIVKKIAVLCFIAIIINDINAQQFVSSQKVFSKSTNYKFDNQWQYVSSDIYLINANRFNYLLNNINPADKKKKKNKDFLSNILVTAQLDGLGDLDKIVYPIFNFQVKKDDKGNLNAQVSEPEVIRLVDNIPISLVKDYIGAKIQIQAYTQSTKPEIYKFIANQLTLAPTLATLTTSPDAIFKIIGEIGKMMQNDAAGKQYQFESTIRIYEDPNFERRFHSLTIFTFLPSYLKEANFNDKDISRYIDTAQNPVFSKNILRDVIKYNNFPYVVVVNYRTKYKTKLSDDIMTENLYAREMQNETFYQNNRISKEVYEQEKNLISFLRTYVQLQTDIGTYEVNYKAKTTEDFTILLFIVLQDYWKLKNTYRLINKANSGNPLYENQFKPYYERYNSRANLLFETTSALRNIKDAIETIYWLEDNGIARMDSLQREDNLRKLKSIQIPPREAKSDEAVVIDRWIKQLEAEQYQKTYLPLINSLNSRPVNRSTYYQVEKLKINVSNSNCSICKDMVMDFVSKFNAKFEEFLFKENNDNYNDLRNQGKQLALNNSRRILCLKSAIDTNIASNNNSYWQLIQKTIDNIETKNLQLIEISSKTANFKNSQQIEEQINLLNYLIKEIEADFITLTNDRNFSNCFKDQNNSQAEKNE